MARKSGGSRGDRDRESRSKTGRGDWIAHLPEKEVDEILDCFERERADHGKPDEAMAILLEAAAGVVAGRLSDGADPEESLRAVGLRSASTPLEHELRLVRPASELLGRLPIAPYFDPGRRFRLVHHITYTVLVGGGVNNVPSPDCMDSHLPDDRKPSREELEKAWEACTQ